MFGARCSVFGIRCLVFGVNWRVSAPQTPNTKNRTPNAGSRHLIPEARHLSYLFQPPLIHAIINTQWFKPMNLQNPNSHLPVCWLHQLVCPRRHLAVLPSQVRPSLFGSD